MATSCQRSTLALGWVYVAGALCATTPPANKANAPMWMPHSASIFRHLNFRGGAYTGWDWISGSAGKFSTGRDW